MTNKYISSTAFIFAIVVSAFLSPLNKYFLPNFLFHLFPQIVTLLLFIFLRAKPQIISACSFSFTIFLLFYGLWVESLPHYEGFEWLGYDLSIPGGVIGTIIIFVYYNFFKPQQNNSIVFICSFLIISLGLTVNCFIVFNTVMHGPLTITKI
ncbi:hypothetical protein JWJ90_21720 [Desulfobulbus rhabdoformis]|uniref:hypothetical protein n=1 Tax=Desulfobulbus rhabdoformis TaxID=34032 RepID=UPI0019656712|nr:hypothetical protein [Desulfobulbus rhabdoformis]MBM9616885.1 hypothetical protein [Desulfobulbus rhabdoformis]